ncbi:MAG: DNA mismatch repair protein MutS [Stecheria intestinalis]|uniref:DNA mismatch repair protein MutS n=1 Tax=Stecheria intestinalis TaxID=2606630 RepID=UPI0023F27A24|nr:DNA mismatch repair protein MutS [Stecheria intestinalis]MCI2153577.1 DNA mismatch repair protein MutS [Solobacterium sp.]MDY3233637.1 DNA mismatch repair protein MutS [Erysipelotrichaceae bacterium]MDY4681302.1 DNA mismatch repair protein MutS [Lachnospiraceae bacterium]MDD5881595.1 DNA mismatch repair protein MutS [Stecheria intestinalis]MDD6366727.1 DNA mismatch repair protein MutS [Stecheria intestinalis]
MAEKTETYTPMMQQYLKVKENYPDALVFYRIGDFYEMFFDDAKTASRELDLVLTGKNAGVKDRVPMCGVPHHAVGSYIQRLVQRGYKIAIVEQMQDPKEAVGLVERDVIRVITPGTVIDEIGDEKESVYLASVEDYGYGYSVVMAEVSTGENFVENVAHTSSALAQNLLKNNAREIVVRKDFDNRVIRMLREMQIVISYCDETEIREEYLPLCENLTRDPDRIAYGRMLNYLEATQKHMLAHLQTVSIEDENSILYMDFSTQQNLELIESLHRQSKGQTLWTFLDVCRSSMGSRLLKKWIEKPLVNQAEIEKRYDRLEYLKKHFMNRQNLRDHLGQIYDLQRLITRIAMNSANAIDCLRLSKTLNQVPEILAAADSTEFDFCRSVDPLSDLAKKLDGAFVENPPVLTSEGGMFRDGYSKELDEARTIQRNGREFISRMEAEERERTGIKTLKIGYNKVFGYYIEISKAAAAQVKEEWGYVRKQTLVGNERFISPQLKEKEDMILHAEENAIRIEKQLFAELTAEIRKSLAKLQKLSIVLAEIDCYAALAEISSRYGYVRPEFTDDELKIESGRHPILDEMMKDPKYVANSVEMNKDESILLITGPNMGGKSTYMRQTALIIIMAQMGCYVPAKSCRMPVFDRIFTRIGASDDILSGQSTFMVEMTEANRALQEATSHSLILFDEIGRGTSTYDGMALAQAMIEYIAACIHAKTLFSTHYHELTTLTDSIGCVRNVHVVVKEENDKVTFLYKIRDGAADRSYGINVARLAGLPDAVLERARGLQKELESKKRVVQQSYQLVEMKKEDPTAEDILKKLRDVNPDDLSPREAWTMLEDLASEAKKKE